MTREMAKKKDDEACLLTYQKLLETSSEVKIQQLRNVKWTIMVIAEV